MESEGFRTTKKILRSTDTIYSNILKRKMRPRDGLCFSRSYSDRAEAKVQSYLLFCSPVLFLLYYDSDYNINGKES